MPLFRHHIILIVFIATLFSSISSAISLDIDDDQSILSAAALVARGVQNLYQPDAPNSILGKWPYPPYYWWESGGAWGGMIEYWHFTGDTTYNNVTYQAITYQLSLSPNNDFNIPSEDFDTGNDDQSFWVIIAMSAAEYGFPEPTPPLPSWLSVVTNAWEDFVQRWGIDSVACGGGLRWHFQESAAGWNYKNSISNGLFFQISARLARFTGNQTYVDWSHKIWNWTTSIGMIDNMYNVYDGSDVRINCTKLDHHQWTYNLGAYLYGAAALANYTNSSTIWVQRTAGLLDATQTFVSPYNNATDILFEAYCELANDCTANQLSLKAYLVRWMAGTSILAPFTASRVGAIFLASAPGAAAACTGGSSGQSCGMKWYINGSDGTTGLGQQLDVLELMYALRVNQTGPPQTGPGVTISLQPDNITDILRTATAAIPAPTGTARPLFDGPRSGAGTGSPEILKPIGWILTPVLAALMIA